MTLVVNMAEIKLSAIFIRVEKSFLHSTILFINLATSTSSGQYILGYISVDIHYL